MITKFGQDCWIEIYSDKGFTNKVFSTKGLRNDFFVKVIPGLNRAKFDIYNMNPATVKEVVNGDRYIKLFTQLHDRGVKEFPYSFYVNNAITITRQPNRITELYCVDSKRRGFTDKQINQVIKGRTFTGYIKEILRYNKSDVKINTEDMPEELLKYQHDKPVFTWTGNLMDSLQKFAGTYGVYVYEEGDTIKFIHPSKESDASKTGESKKQKYKLKTVNMKTNPKIGIANMEFTSILDTEIRAGLVVDASELLTASSLETFDTLTIMNNAIKSNMSGYSLYKVLTIEHKGSNYTDEWETSAMAVKASKGTHMPTYGWFR